MYQTDKIAILLATYNGEKYIGEQLESLLNQTYTEWIAYIHDDGSSDRTLSILNKYQKSYPEHFQIVEGKTTGGAKQNFFYLMEKVDAPYVMFCDQDDIWKSRKIQITLDAMEKIESENEKEVPLLVFTELNVVDSNKKIIAKRMSDIQKLNCKRTKNTDIMIQNNVTGCTMMINRKLLTMANDIKNQKNIIMHDWWCALIAAEFGQLCFIEHPTILYRQHEKNSVGAKNINSLSYIINKMMKYREIKNSLERTQVQAKEFARVYELPADHVISQYADVGKQNKIKRLRFYRKNHISKSGRARNLGFWLWG